MQRNPSDLIIRPDFEEDVAGIKGHLIKKAEGRRCQKKNIEKENLNK